MPLGEDGDFAKKCVVAQKNRYKDKFPCKFKDFILMLYRSNLNSMQSFIAQFVDYVVKLTNAKQMHNYVSCALCFSNTDSTNYLPIAGRNSHNASDYINASLLAVSAHVLNSIELHLAHDMLSRTGY